MAGLLVMSSPDDRRVACSLCDVPVGVRSENVLLNPEQVAAVLQVPVALLYKWRYARTGPPSLKVGRYLRYRAADLRAWLDGLVSERGLP
jgi:predicted DNA-binding transcriptional regulator AlpA